MDNTELPCCGSLSPKKAIIGETAYSPEDRAVNLWPFYNAALPVNVMSVGETDCTPDYYVTRPCSGIMAIEYITSGSGVLEINNKSYRPQKGCAILLIKNSFHSYAADSDNPWKKNWIVFDGSFMQNMIDAYLPRNEYCFPDCDLAPYFQKIKEQLRKHKGNYEQLLEILSVILFEMVLCISRTVRKQEHSLPEKIRFAIDAQIEGSLSLDAISNQFNYSKNHIITLFRDAYGITPYRYFEAKKAEAAKLYLYSTDLSIEEIARLLSYADRYYFSNCFKKFTGCTPAEYRRKHQFSRN